MNKTSINTSKQSTCLRRFKQSGEKVAFIRSFRRIRKDRLDENSSVRLCLQQQCLKSGKSRDKKYQQQLQTVPIGLSQSALEHCIKLIVQNLDQAPFVQAVQTSPNFQSQHIQVPQEVLTSPFVWMDVQQRLQHIVPNALILINEITQQKSNCPLDQSKSRNQLDPIPLCKLGIQNIQNQWQTQEKELFHGKLGDCCDEDEHEHTNNSDSTHSHAHLPYNNKISAPSPIPEVGEQLWQDQVQALSCSKKSAHNNSLNSYNIHTNYNGYGGAKQYEVNPEQCETKKQHWGVVIQTEEMSLVQGCYLLTTTQNRGQHGCCCTHFHLTRVCKGLGLDYQLMSSWLGSSLTSAAFSI